MKDAIMKEGKLSEDKLDRLRIAEVMSHRILNFMDETFLLSKIGSNDKTYMYELIIICVGSYLL
jgi:hypothetical protein